MNYEDTDRTVQRLRSLTVHEPDPARSERVRMRCRAVLVDRQVHGERVRGARRFTTFALESGLTLGLSVGYLSAMIYDLLRVYLRR